MSTASRRLLRVRVTPGAKREVIEQKGGVLFVSVKEKAIEGKANERVRELVAHACAVPVKNVQLKKGHQSPSKLYIVRELES